MSTGKLTLGLFLVAVALFLSTLGGDFLNYDDWWLVHNPALLGWLTPGGLWDTFFGFSHEIRMEHGAEYLPVRDLSAALQYVMFGENPLPYHIVQVVLFAGSVSVLFHVLLHIGASRSVAVITSLLFAAHPIHVESVAWLTGHKDLLSLFFFLLSLWHYVRGRTGAALIMFGLALGSKYTIVFLPLLLPLVDRCQDRQLSWKRYAPFLGVAVVSFVLASWVGRTVRYAHVDFGQELKEPLLNLFVLFEGYTRHLVAPLGLQMFYPFPDARSWFDIRVGLGFVELITLVTMFGWGWKREPKIALAVGLWILGLLVTVRAPAIHLMADRYLLIPSIGFSLLLALGLGRLGPKGVRYSLVGFLVVSLGVLTQLQNRVWNSSLALWENAAKGEVPVRRRVWRNLAAVLSDLGAVKIGNEDFAGAERVLTEAIRLSPPTASTYQNLGVALARQRKGRAAKSAFENARKLDPDNPEPLFNLARLALERGKPDEANEHLRWLLEKAPADPRTEQLRRVLGRP